MNLPFLMRTLALSSLLFLSCSGLSAQEDKFLSDLHVAKGVPCQTCHGEGMQNKEVPTGTCLQCHGGTYENLAKTTEDRGDINFHDTHIGEANCGECHKGHRPSHLVCDQCHEFKAKVP